MKLFDHQISPFAVAFERSQHPQLNGVARAQMAS